MKDSSHLTGIKSNIGKEKSVQSMFSSIANTYDINNTLLSFGLHYLWKKQTIATLGSIKGKTILDLCSGTADLGLQLSKLAGEKGHIVAADLNLEMLKVGKAKPSKIKNIQFIRCNAELTGFKDNSFDGVTVAFGMRNLSNLQQGFNEIYRILKKGGKMACLEFSRPVYPAIRYMYDVYSFSLLPLVGKLVSKDKTQVYQYLPESIRNFPPQDELKNIIEKAGFKNVKYKNLSGGIVAIHTGEK